MATKKIDISNFITYDNKSEKLNLFKSLFDAKESFLDAEQRNKKSKKKNKDIIKGCKFKPINKDKIKAKRKGL